MRTSLMAALLLLTAQANAGPCVVLDYQELKDMSVADATAEYCKAHERASKSLDEGIAGLNSRVRSNSQASDHADQCINQVTRIARILISKGVEKPTVATLCKSK